MKKVLILSIFFLITLSLDALQKFNQFYFNINNKTIEVKNSGLRNIYKIKLKHEITAFQTSLWNQSLIVATRDHSEYSSLHIYDLSYNRYQIRAKKISSFKACEVDNASGLEFHSIEPTIVGVYYLADDNEIFYSCGRSLIISNQQGKISKQISFFQEQIRFFQYLDINDQILLSNKSSATKLVDVELNLVLTIEHKKIRYNPQVDKTQKNIIFFNQATLSFESTNISTKKKTVLYQLKEPIDILSYRLTFTLGRLSLITILDSTFSVSRVNLSEQKEKYWSISLKEKQVESFKVSLQLRQKISLGEVTYWKKKIIFVEASFGVAKVKLIPQKKRKSYYFRLSSSKKYTCHLVKKQFRCIMPNSITIMKVTGPTIKIRAKEVYTSKKIIWHDDKIYYLKSHEIGVYSIKKKEIIDSKKFNNVLVDFELDKERNFIILLQKNSSNYIQKVSLVNKEILRSVKIRQQYHFYRLFKLNQSLFIISKKMILIFNVKDFKLQRKYTILQKVISILEHNKYFAVLYDKSLQVLNPHLRQVQFYRLPQIWHSKKKRLVYDNGFSVLVTLENKGFYEYAFSNKAKRFYLKKNVAYSNTDDCEVVLGKKYWKVFQFNLIKTISPRSF